MKKISTLFKKDPSDLSLVTNQINEENQWVFDGFADAYRKWDGTAVLIENEIIFKRYDAKKGKVAPVGAIPCQEADPITGHHPYWVKCDHNKPEDKYFFEGYNSYVDLFGCKPVDGTYELIGEKINGNSEKIQGHHLVSHKAHKMSIDQYDYDFLKNHLKYLNIEGIVIHHKTDGRMCKIRKSDFGLKREINIEDLFDFYDVESNGNINEQKKWTQKQFDETAELVKQLSEAKNVEEQDTIIFKNNLKYNNGHAK